MKKYKNRLIAAAVILAALLGAWLWGGNYNKSDNSAQRSAAQIEETLSITDDVTITPDTPDITETSGVAEPPDIVFAPPVYTEPMELITSYGDTMSIENEDENLLPSEFREQSGETIASEEGRLTGGEELLTSGEERLTSGQSATEGSAAQSESGSDENPDTGLDMYQTSQVPDGRPAPVEPQDVTVGDGSFTVTLTVRCDMILNNMNLLNKEKHELVPSSGMIFPATIVTVYEGESVFNTLQREMRRAGIHMAFRNTPIYNSAYIEAINNLYEFDVGELSGWMYKVNGWFPNYGCSRYKLQPGDVIEWHYTCDLGRDLGEYWLGSGWGQIDD